MKITKVIQKNISIIHDHSWVLQYRTGNAEEGKTEVLKCDCGQWAIRHYGQSEKILIK